MLFADHNSLIFEILEKRVTMSPGQIDDLQATHTQTGKALAEVALAAGVLSRETLLRTVADHEGLRYLEKIPHAVPTALRETVPTRLARDYGIVPVEDEGGKLILLAVDPLNPFALDDLTFALGRDIEIALADPEAVKALLDSTYGRRDSVDLAEILRGVEMAEAEVDTADVGALAMAARDAPVIRFVDAVLRDAVRRQSSDVHFEPFEDAFRVRFRIDGALQEVSTPARVLAVPVISRIKVLADLNIAERRVPQDGRIQMTVDGRAVDMRVSTLPTQFGESVVLRVLDKSVVNLNLDALGMPPGILGAVRELARRPNGIFIVTGPTGSGKTTTLNSALREVNDEETKILTAEDPVEYEIDGIMQVAVNAGIGLTFATALRSFLRQDPDKILVGEIRDLETARIAVQASLTGHLVFSTLHTNDAAGAVTRLVDMGLEPYLIAASLEAVLAQRLVRRVCRECSGTYRPGEDDLARLGIDHAAVGEGTFARGRGCAACGGSGYRGRLGLYELIRVTDRFREAVVAGATTLDLAAIACEEGTRTLRQDGIRALLDHATTAEEILRYT